MELLINNTPVNKSSVRRINKQEFIPGGILNSSYQKVVKHNAEVVMPDSIYGIRNTVKSRTSYHATSIETIIKVVVFLIILGLIF
ncbi:hypothetical protein SAMN03097699_2010 [Flavobacteriaceae bacterium MAR_2010_188]|nr:hypothetical protein SAMN03097699_2010 [Flavobacteriaceae bacterium MAR_2010_188]